ncbi:MAG: hypothetical protein E6Q89_02070 [Bacteroidia bacterium]|nr:MAG: hypothetical protein E6Q89_02070 [Bacteroidia bacterium]
MFKELIDILNEMAALIESEEDTVEKDDRLQELYYEAKEALADLSDALYSQENFREQDDRQFHQLKKQFKSLCRKFETPDDILDSTMNDMFPDGMDDGFNADDFFDRD